MIFSGEDLKRLKKSKFEDCEWIMTWNKLKDLIARFEASERVALEADYCRKEGFFSDELSDYIKAWRKAAGK